uniref:Beta-2-microglobulin n=1 Tax=Electrophorus electricus TaxID=8005 RepID=A0A4W4GMF6_ELEEL
CTGCICLLHLDSVVCSFESFSVLCVAVPKVQVYSYSPGEFDKDNVLICHGWMFQLTKSVHFKPRKGEEYTCRVRHMENTRFFTWGKKSMHGKYFV